MRLRALFTLTVACLLIGCSMAGSKASAGGSASENRLLELEREATRSRLEIERLQRRVGELESANVARVQSTAPTPTAPAALEMETPAPRQPSAAIEESELAEEVGERSPELPEGGRYEAALKLLRDGRAQEAESALAHFAADYPDSDLADNAWFWIAESRLVRGDLAGALAAYRITLERYPEGNKVPDALLKLGTTLALDGKLDSAQEAWRELIRRFPDTAAAEAARERLGGE